MKNFPEHYKELSSWMEKLGVSIPAVMQGFGTASGQYQARRTGQYEEQGL